MTEHHLPESNRSWSLHSHTASDGYVWNYRLYPATEKIGNVVYLHGIQSHAGWYEYSCSRLAQAGYEVAFLDRRGSGTNQEARGDAPSFRRLLDDIAEFLTPKRAEPTFVVGVSWGGKLAAALQWRHPGLCDGLALLCPGFFPQIRPSFGKRLGIFASSLVRPRRLYPIPLNEPELFTATPRWLEFLRNDALGLHEATARFLVHSTRLDMYLRWVPKRVKVPTLLMLSGRDRIIDNDRTRAYVEKFAGPTEVQLYPDAQHTLEFEPDPAFFVDDLLQWLNRK